MADARTHDRRDPCRLERRRLGSSPRLVLAFIYLFLFFAMASHQGVGGNDCALRREQWPRSRTPTRLSREGIASDGERTVPGFMLRGLERPQEPRTHKREREILGIVPCPRRSAIQRLPAPTREAKRDPEVPKSVPGTGRDDEKRKGNSAGSRWRTGCLSPHPLPIAPP